MNRTSKQLPHRFTTEEVFTPSTVARLTFVDRAKVNKRLVNALKTTGKQLVIFGRSGGGKTTLLTNKLEQTYPAHIVTKCMNDTSYFDCLLDAFDQLSPFYEESRMVNFSTESGAAVSTQYRRIKLELASCHSESREVVARRVVPPQLNASFLARLLGEVDACWVLEDIHKMASEERRKVAQAMKLFMDSADAYPATKMVLIGAVGSARDIVSLDSEMWNRVSEIEVELMVEQELDQIIAKGEECLNIRVPRNIREGILHYCNGLPAVAHQLCLNMCQEADIYETLEATYTFKEGELFASVQAWLEDATESLREAYDRATRTDRKRKYDNCRLIVHAIASLGPTGGTFPEILRQIRRDARQYPSSNLTQYLKVLQDPRRGQPLIHDPASGKYSFAWPMLHAYTRAQVKGHKKKNETAYFNEELELARALGGDKDLFAALAKIFSKRPSG